MANKVKVNAVGVGLVGIGIGTIGGNKKYRSENDWLVKSRYGHVTSWRGPDQSMLQGYI